MLTIDGSQGEGGGQVLRTALALSTCMGKPFRINNIRAHRRKPGLQPQHLASVNAAATISRARVEGAERDSLSLLFNPAAVVAGEYHFDIGTAGSTSLVLQTILPGLLLVRDHSNIVLEGGTHNPLAPTFEFLKYAFLPAVNQTGARVTAHLERPGFAPRGGGRILVQIEPGGRINSLELLERGDILQRHAEVLLANLPDHIAQRELAVIHEQMAVGAQDLHAFVTSQAQGAGNALAIVLQSKQVAECFTALGKKGLPAEEVAWQAVAAAKRYLAAGVPVGQHLADQLLLYLALAGGGRLLTLPPSSHTLTNIKVIEHFTGVAFAVHQQGLQQWEIHYAR